MAAMCLHEEGNALLSPMVVCAVGKTNRELLGFRVKTPLSQEKTGGHIAKLCRLVLEGGCCAAGKGNECKWRGFLQTHLVCFLKDVAYLTQLINAVTCSAAA